MDTVKFCLMVLVSGFVSGCQAPPDTSADTASEVQALPLPAEPVNSPFSLIDVVQPDSLFALSEEQKDRFLTFYNSRKQRSLAGHKRLHHYIEDMLEDFDYRGRTYIAKEALSRQSGNCMTLALMTAALARLVDIDYQFQIMNSQPMYHRRGNVLTVSSHVRVHLYDPDYRPGENIIVMMRPKIIVDYFPDTGDVSGHKISHQSFIGKMFQNLAAQALEQNQTDKAYSLVKRAIEVTPDDPEAVNLLAVLYKQHGLTAVAEKFYRHALDHFEPSLNVTSNLALLLEEQGRFEESDQLRQQIMHVDNHNPYLWINKGYQRLKHGQHGEARLYFQKANKLASYIPDGDLGIAKSYLYQGNISQAKRFMVRAVNKAYTPEKTRYYQAKLTMLNQLPD